METTRNAGPMPAVTNINWRFDRQSCLKTKKKSDPLNAKTANPK
jgi:hypothetical protein